MARYTGPVCKLCRREGMKLFLKAERCLTPKCAVERRNTPPGQQQAGARRRRPTEFSIQWREKQKARRIYGVLEAPFGPKLSARAVKALTAMRHERPEHPTVQPRGGRCPNYRAADR